ncbi:nucleotidyltransferase [Chitinophaga alhagiae]|uniref:Nucleotidyltransferase n=1 Tax=Chitinophaga alhagiae TaxID=2203219 RepID=A0ABN5LPP8_9BACT|nr:DNA polymerase Y family protein [Chitinophaga alhagiae]AWO01356.1 nucleotidyltransferase [Chitinophaga alhagiae]
MRQRFISIWFRHLTTDWCIRRQPVLRNAAFVLSAPDHGRLMVTAANAAARQQGIDAGMTVADARALVPHLQVLDDQPGLPVRLLTALGEWCIRFTPLTAIDPPDGLILNVSGCAHLWGGEEPYLTDIVTRLKNTGYEVRAAMADTMGAAWAIARFGKFSPIIAPGEQFAALLPLPPAALRLEPAAIERLHKLGLHQVRGFIGLQRSALRRRFGAGLLQRLDQALGLEREAFLPLQPVEPYQERLPCLEPIVTGTGIEIALQKLLETLCARLRKEEKGLRTAVLEGHRVDGKIEQVEIGTNRPSHNAGHLFKLFELKVPSMEPALGIELFVLHATRTEAAPSRQDAFWNRSGALEDVNIAELLDRLTGKMGPGIVHRYLPAEHYWPERSMKPAADLQEKNTAAWPANRPRPIRMLPRPEPITVTAPIPDYPPMLFRYKGKLHTIKKADGPERIEREWWLEGGEHRDYYCVEDEEGRRYWLFRSGHYDVNKPRNWFIHGFFA